MATRDAPRYNNYHCYYYYYFFYQRTDRFTST